MKRDLKLSYQSKCDKPSLLPSSTSIARLVLKLGIKIGSIDIQKMERKSKNLQKMNMFMFFRKFDALISIPMRLHVQCRKKTVLNVFKGVFVPTFTKMK